MYNRSNDFIEFDNSDVKYFGLPPKEICVFPINNGWAYEMCNNNSFDLKDLNNDCGTFWIEDIALEWDEIFDILELNYPDYVITCYENQATWWVDKKSRCWK